MTNKPVNGRELAAWVLGLVGLVLLFLIAMTLITGDGSHAHPLQQISGSHWQAPTRPTP